MKLSLNLLLSLATLAGSAGADVFDFTYVDLGTLPGGTASVAYGLNDAGQVVGWSTIPGCLTAKGQECRRAYVWQKGAMTDLGKLAGDEDSFARSINNKGLIVGTSESNVLFGSGTYHGVSWQGGVITALPDLGNGTSFALDVNDAGVITGHSVDPVPMRDRAVVWQGGVIQNVGKGEPHSYNRLQGLNENGDFVGFAWDLFSPNDSIAYDGKGWSTIGGFGQFENSEASDVNDNGLVVGLQAFPSGAWHAATWQLGGKFATDAGTLPGLNTGELYGVNNDGLAVGRSYDSIATGNSRAILWDGTQLIDLNDLLPPGSKEVLYEARDINENGDIVGTAVVNGQFRAFLLQRNPGWSQYDVAASPANTIDLDGAGSTSIGTSMDAVASLVGGDVAVFGVALGKASFPLLGGQGLVDPTTLFLIAPRAAKLGQSVFTMDFPNDKAFVGLELFVQAVTPLTKGPLAFELSNGLKVTVCP